MTERDRLFLGHVLEAIAAIAGMRDRLIHGYFKVDLDAVWSMIEKDLPPLKENTRRILGLN